VTGLPLTGAETVASGGIVTGIGRVHGRLVAFAANDATVKGGTYYPVTVKVSRVSFCLAFGLAAVIRSQTGTHGAFLAACRSTCGCKRLLSDAVCPAATLWTPEGLTCHTKQACSPLFPCFAILQEAKSKLRCRPADVFPDRDHFGRIFYNQVQ